jgi:hypothetical protein
VWALNSSVITLSARQSLHVTATMMTVDRVWHRCRLATLSPGLPGLGLVEDGLIAADRGNIVYAGPALEAPTGFNARESIDCDGRWTTGHCPRRTSVH